MLTKIVLNPYPLKSRNRHIFLTCLTLLGLILSIKSATAQTEDHEPHQHLSVEFQDTLGLEYHYVHTGDIYTIHRAVDSLDVPVFLSDVYSSGKNRYINTGNYSSAAFELYKKIDINTGFNTGYNQYRPYQISKENFRFYEQNRPVSNLFFSQTGSQDNIAVGADFSRNFENGISVSLNYKRLSQKGFFNEQDTKSTALGIGFRYENPSKRYNGILVFIQNANEERFNGGIVADSLLSERFRKAIPTLLADASGRQQEQTLSFVQYYKLIKATDKKWSLYLSNDLTYQPSYYKFWDNNIDSTAQVYYDIPDDLLIANGIRRYTDIKKFSESFFIHGDNGFGIKGKVGLAYDYYTVNDHPLSHNRSDLTAIAEGNVPFLKVLQIDLKGRLGLLKNIGTFDISGSLDVNVGKIGILSGGMRVFRYEPSYRSTLLSINEVAWTNNTFSNPFGTAFHGTLKIPKINLSISINQSIINNPVYWDMQGKAVQFNESIFTLSQLDIHHKLLFKHFGLENDAYFQLQSNPIYPIPDIFSTHKIYYQDTWFDEAMDISIGFEGRIIPAYKGPSFQPMLGIFHLNDTSLPLAPEVNFFIHAKISSFRALISMDNISRYFIKTNQYNVYSHPVFDPVFRFGLQWLLKD